ncbi:MAG: TolC family protein [Planctomycetaceae bacterium]
MADLTDPDCGPLPPDDPDARRYMARPYKSRGSSVWRKRGELPTVEFEHWKQFLPIDEEGAVKLNRATSMELALLHSRDYQTQVEGVYLTALPVSLQRFQYDTQWNGGFGAHFFNQGINTTGAVDTLTLNDDLGFSKRFASGGQLLADFSNAMVWELSGQSISANSVLSFQFLQPLMRRAFRSVQLEPLTLAERNLLYSVRNFSRFRRAFYVDTAGSNGYLGLLAIAQAVRNEESNLESLRLNLDEHDALYLAGRVSQFQVDQVFQQYQQSRLSLLRARQALQVAFDQFKLQLGLPPTLEVTLDSDELKLFELSDPRLDQLTDENESVRVQLLQYSELRLPADEDVDRMSDEQRQTLNETIRGTRSAAGRATRHADAGRTSAGGTHLCRIQPADVGRT